MMLRSSNRAANCAKRIPGLYRGRASSGRLVSDPDRLLDDSRRPPLDPALRESSAVGAIRTRDEATHGITPTRRGPGVEW
jgi:hypothetical protein